MDFNKLKEQFPRLKVQNRTSVPQTILYQNGDSVQIQPHSTRFISSENLLQIPNINNFDLLDPTIFQLRDAGIIELQVEETVKPTPTPVKTPAPKPKLSVDSGTTSSPSKK